MKTFLEVWGWVIVALTVCMIPPAVYDVVVRMRNRRERFRAAAVEQITARSE
jgi:hypothetical protein